MPLEKRRSSHRPEWLWITGIVIVCGLILFAVVISAFIR